MKIDFLGLGTMSEATALVQGHGLDRAHFLDLLTSTVFTSPVYKA
ncbi:MAG: hypothetical protein RLZZ237_1413 [Pseudomonadota bacterium]|jgi:3-hydroxyisobutyrate dehydrogenase-like beta-hydroxyacid dehydrogenase